MTAGFTGLVEDKFLDRRGENLFSCSWISCKLLLCVQQVQTEINNVKNYITF